MLVYIVSGGYMPSPHSSGIPLQQQLQHANEKSGFNESEKYKMQQVLLVRLIRKELGAVDSMYDL